MGSRDESKINEMAHSDTTFDLRAVHSNFELSLLEDEDVELISYINAYKDLYNFFVLLGSAFGFVASDVKSKIKILEDLHNNKDKTVASNFESVKKMITYEKENKLFNKAKYVNGSRTLLRLHRGLHFVIEFLTEVQSLENSVGTGAVCRQAYDKTLAPHHTWVVKKAATLAMHMLPTKENLVKKMILNSQLTAKDVTTLLPQMLDVSKVVYNRVESVFTHHHLHDLK